MTGPALKRVLLVPDGMADEPLAGARRPHAARGGADAHHGRAGARAGTVGLVSTVPDGHAGRQRRRQPGRARATTRVAVYTGRAPLEAASIGVELGPDDVAYRCNLVTIAGGVMATSPPATSPGRRARGCGPHAAARGAGSTAGPFEFHAGVSYRNLLVWRGGRADAAA